MTAAAPIKVLIVEDSPVVQRLLEHTIARDPRLKVVGKAANAEQAVTLIAQRTPDVVTMDIRLPGINGFELTRRIMSENPLPIVVVAENVDDASLNISMNALRAGALSVVEKPGSTERQRYEALAAHLCTQLVIMSQVKVVRQRFAPRKDGTAGPPPQTPPPAPPQARRGGYDILALVASTGGPNALVRVLNDLPRGLGLPIVVVQHIGDRFAAGFASWLDSVCPQPVTLAEDGQVPQTDRVYVAPGGFHLTFAGRRFRTTMDAPVCQQRPSGDVLLRSMAASHGRSAIAVLMTGMGEDGARGLLELKRAGAYTIAEDQSTAVIYGMPQAAVRLGAAVDQLPLGAIAARIAWLAASNSAREAG